MLKISSLDNFRCRKATDAMLHLLKHKNHKVVKLTLDLVEICSKNGNLQFHKNLSTQEFSDQFLLLLKRVIDCNYSLIFHRDVGRPGYLQRNSRAWKRSKTGSKSKNRYSLLFNSGLTLS